MVNRMGLTILKEEVKGGQTKSLQSQFRKLAPLTFSSLMGFFRKCYTIKTLHGIEDNLEKHSFSDSESKSNLEELEYECEDVSDLYLLCFPFYVCICIIKPMST